MGQTPAGSIKQRQTMLEKYGPDFYKEIGKKGGSRTTQDGAKPKGFAAMPP